MISEIIDTIKLLEREGFDKKEATQIILINEIKELKEVLKNGRKESN
jgi:hypothetical protein